MAWISYGGRSGAAILENRRGRHQADNDSNSDDGGDAGGPPRFKGVPLCGAGICSGPGLPPKRLPRPGIDCVNGDQPCLPCDIVNVHLRVAVTGSKVKRAVAECQKRYFCRVWNLLFTYLFPGEHQDGPCPYLKPNDPMPICRGQPQKVAWRRRQQKPQQLPFGADPGKAIGPVEDMQMTDHRVRRRLVNKTPKRPLPAKKTQPPPQPPPPPPLKQKLLAPLPPAKTPAKVGNLRYNLIDRPYMANDNLKSLRMRGATPNAAQNRRMKANFYDLPAMDSQKKA